MGIFFKKNKNDESDLYKILFETYHKKVYKIAYYMTGNEHDAKDIVQDTFIKAFDKIDTLKDKDKFESWICTIACNLAKNKFRKSEREMLIDDNNKIVSLFFEEDINLPDKYLEDKQFREYILEQINDLDGHYKQILISYYYLDLSYDEISKALDISIGTVKSRLYRAKGILKSKLENNIDLIKHIG
jgi:RNA polymerase sigma-70 factor (ECF subfamily)